MLRVEVAGLFRVDPVTISRWAKAEKLTCVKTPGGWRRFFGAEVRALLAGESREAARKIGLAEKARLTGVAP